MSEQTVWMLRKPKPVEESRDVIQWFMKDIEKSDALTQKEKAKMRRDFENVYAYDHSRSVRRISQRIAWHTSNACSRTNPINPGLTHRLKEYVRAKEQHA